MSLASEYRKRMGVYNRLATQYNVHLPKNEMVVGKGASERLKYKPSKRITQGSLNRLNKDIKELQRIISVRKAKMEYEEFDKQIPAKSGDTNADRQWVRNFKVFYNDLINRVWEGTSVTSLVKTGVSNVISAINQMIDDAVMEHSYAWVRERLQSYGSSLKKKVTRLVLAVIDTGKHGYNTNENPWESDSAGEAGRARFQEDIEELADRLEQQVPIYILFA